MTFQLHSAERVRAVMRW